MKDCRVFQCFCHILLDCYKYFFPQKFTDIVLKLFDLGEKKLKVAGLEEGRGAPGELTIQES